jgi:hypothetical protein
VLEREDVEQQNQYMYAEYQDGIGSHGDDQEDQDDYGDEDNMREQDVDDDYGDYGEEQESDMDDGNREESMGQNVYQQD